MAVEHPAAEAAQHQQRMRRRRGPATVGRERHLGRAIPGGERPAYMPAISLPAGFRRREIQRLQPLRRVQQQRWGVSAAVE